MPPDFGVLKKVELRAVWSKRRPSSAVAPKTSAPSRSTRMELELQSREAACGDFSCDLLARDLGSSRAVVIENQLSRPTTTTSAS